MLIFNVVKLYNLPIQFPEWRFRGRPNTVKLYAAKQNAVVDVLFVHDPQTQQQVPIGFTGRSWPLFYIENQIEPGRWLIFTDDGSGQQHPYNCEVTVFTNIGTALYQDPEHQCSRSIPTHIHSDESPHYFKQLATHNLESHLLVYSRQKQWFSYTF